MDVTLKGIIIFVGLFCVNFGTEMYFVYLSTIPKMKQTQKKSFFQKILTCWFRFSFYFIPNVRW